MSGLPASNELQKTFITMIFAFAVSAVALQFAELFIVVTNNWTSSWEYSTKLTRAQWLNLGAVLSHSVLALVMITASWIMWSRSKAAGHVAEIQDLFSANFLLVLIEMLLVTLYFSLSKSVESDLATYQRAKSPDAYVTTVSATPEALQMICIFLLFFVWDFVADVLKSPLNPLPTRGFHTVWSWIPGIAVYCSVSLICVAGAFSILIASTKSASSINAILGDVALVALVLFFYQAKIFEHYFLKVATWQATRSNTKRVPTSKNWYAILVLVFVFACCQWSMYRVVP